MRTKQVMKYAVFIEEQEDKLSILKHKWKEIGSQIRSMSQKKEENNIKLRRMILGDINGTRIVPKKQKVD